MDGWVGFAWGEIGGGCCLSGQEKLPEGKRDAFAFSLAWNNHDTFSYVADISGH